MAKIENSNQTTKSLSDYIHLYIGCPMITPDSEGRTETLQGVYKINDGRWRVTSNESNYWASEVQIILSPITGFNLADLKAWAKLVDPENHDGATEDDFAVIASDIRELGLGAMESTEVHFAEFYKFLLSRGFDLFGLIPAGLAISSLDLKGGSNE